MTEGATDPAALPSDEPGPSPPTLTAGDCLGRYTIVRRLAEGGMAEVFLARAQGVGGFQKLVAVKRALRHLAGLFDFDQMFIDEARIAGSFDHPNVVQIFDVDSCDEGCFMAMEYLRGKTLREIASAYDAKKERVPLASALAIVADVCAGLHYVHEHTGVDDEPLHIVHRDVTPQNVIVTFHGVVKLLDFGIAKSANRVGRTQLGAVVGKIPYMSPEQCRGDVLDRRSDLYSLGVILYELTVGRRLYHRECGDFDLLKEIVEGEIAPPRSVSAIYPPELEAIVMKALAKRREDRYATAAELGEALRRFVDRAGWPPSSGSLSSFMTASFGDGRTPGEELLLEVTTNRIHAALPAPQKRRSDTRRSRRITARERPIMSLELDEPTIAKPSRWPVAGVWAAAAVGLIAMAVVAIGWWRKAPSPSLARPAIAMHSVAATVDAGTNASAPSPIGGAPAEVKIDAAPALPQPARATVRVTVSPPATQLLLDGVELVDTTGWNLVEPDRAHVVIARRRHFADATAEFTPTANETLTVHLAFKRERPPLRRAATAKGRAASRSRR